MKLEIESVEFKNFLTFGSRVQRIPFLKGLNLVTGIDMDRKRSNGSGKSSLLESVPFALFGQVHRNINKKQIVNWKNRKKCEVSLDFKIGSDDYKVSRAIKPDNFEIYKNNTLIDKPSHVKEYQLILEEIIGMNYKTFMSLIHSNINSSAKILTMGKPEKRKLIDTMFGLTVYKNIQEHSNKKLRGIIEKLKEIEITSSSNVDRISDLKSTVDDLEFKYSAKPIQYTQLKEKEEELDEIKEILDDSKKELEKKRTLLADKESSLKYFEMIEGNIKNSLYKIGVKLKSINDSLAKSEKIERIKKENNRYNDMIDGMRTEYGSLDEIERNLTDKRKEVTDLEKDIVNERNNLSALSKEISNLERDEIKSSVKLEKLEKDICPTCNQRITDESLLKSERIKLDSTKLKIESSKEKERKSSNRYDNKKLKLPNFTNTIDSYDTIRKEMIKISDKIINIDLSDNIDKLKSDKSRYDRTFVALESLAGKTEHDKLKIEKTISLLSERIGELQERVSKVYDLEQEIIKLEEFIELERKNQKSLKSLIDSNRKKITLLNKKTSESTKKKETLMNLKNYVSLIKDICKDENIKQYAISSIMPYINERANYYLSKVNYSFYVVLDKWLDMQIKGPGIVDASYGSLSGGESRGIDIAIQLAFLDISKLRANIFPDFLTLDELLDSSIDSGGISQLFKIISLKQKKDDSKTFIISHRSELDEMADVDNIYHVTKKGGYSTVEIT